MSDSNKTVAQKPHCIRYLSRDLLQSLQLSVKEIVASIEHLILGQNLQQAWSAPKVVITPPDGRYMMATLAAADNPPFLAVKALVLNPDNPKQGFESINALVILLDSHSGLPLAIIDGNWVTAVRTAGLSAVAAKRLARPDASIAAFIGCGVQAHSHLQALAAMFPLKQIQAFGRGTASRDAFCRSAEKLGLMAIASQTAQEAVSNADLIVTSVTLAPQLVPFLDARWLKPGAFVTMTDLAAPWLVESMSAFDRIIVDDLKQEASLPKPLVDPALVCGDLTSLVTGDAAGRRTGDERTAFVFRGLAIGDLAVAGLAYQRACESSQGTMID
ncbi:MAG: ornithine cyclodeaminase family protein [Nitrosomonas sp.]|uniref:ornithine cyclodeaminase family protein n=1 Tax=Nitrosomonas sp. TaxID=42353 RepID=UPI00271CAAC1|nr:ornithine cyclodeaminase family protein [Nitrosomonas sp.]MDO8895228.1 ornithine cyclodeaminase family protein [Nitrosomonas sp.]MDO9471053.1 ornithine cyclodeaminase family protein [Nitrosomonas sp.]MDP1786098.1 ornithine cyclodeaminase family protein [Nitrosomonas sp.]MDP1934512.1 ornithine cyclodeaminase family protein [Nitrosomonas sp.]MDP2223430.1 ornithine cyclodeaminase family protein [Nitrosomonas sp.]